MNMHGSWKELRLAAYFNYVVVNFHFPDLYPALAMLLTFYNRTLDGC